MAKIARIGVDTSKSVFQLHGVDEAERVVLRRKVRRGQFLAFFATLEPTTVGLEACGASHYWARELRKLGHEVVLIPPQYVKPYVARGKNDAKDAEAICEAMSRPLVRKRFVPIKSEEQAAAQMLLGTRDSLVKRRTQLSNMIRSYAAEFGVVVAKGSTRSTGCWPSLPRPRPSRPSPRRCSKASARSLPSSSPGWPPWSTGSRRGIAPTSCADA